MAIQYQTDDVRITGMEEVVAPIALIEEQPLSESASQTVYSTRQQIADLLADRDDRLLAIVGPCSIHDPEAAMEYAARLRQAATTFADQLCVVMRVYFEKPRTTIGWKGLINDPNLNNTYDINLGLRKARGLLRDIVDLGLGTGTEYLDPITPQYVGDLVSWGAIGARTTESQIHRQLASGLSCPIGFKNSTDGSVQIAADAVSSASKTHIFLSVTKDGHSAIFQTAGNEDCHVILRGGSQATNYDAQSVESTCATLAKRDLREKVMIDMSHANSRKQHQNQLLVCEDISGQLASGDRRVFGVMIESNLVAGNQSIGDGTGLTYGQSITDACIGWDDTERCLDQLAQAVEKRRSA
ncbi:MAG: 3-deoxy-7-phosphoheptulonate synthase [Pseudomonadota bacterium]